jgi:hypothetical protein
MRGLVSRLLWLTSTVLAAVAVVLPWGIRCKYHALLRWFRDMIMHNSQRVRRWALETRWSWDSDDRN